MLGNLLGFYYFANGLGVFGLFVELRHTWLANLLKNLANIQHDKEET